MVDLAQLLESVSKLRQRRTAPLVLELDLTEGLVDEPPSDPLGQILAMRRPRLPEIVDGIRRGAADPRVKALIAKVGGRPISLARVQELRAAVAVFRAAGKPTLAWSESFGDFGPGSVPYYLACAFDEIALQPSGTVGLTGVTVTNTFLKDALEKAGVEYEAGARHEYKSAINTFTKSGYTEPEKEAAGRIVDSVSEQLVDGIAEGRDLTPETVRTLVDGGPYMAGEAEQHSLIDRQAYRDEVYSDFLSRFRVPSSDGTGDPHLQYVSRYNRVATLAGRVPTVRRSDYVAVISGNGPIMAGRSRRGPGGSTMGAETVAAAFRAARQDPHLRAVVFRVDSPGGSYSASDTIWREVALTRESGIPVVVSMGDVAASGGYFVALGAEAIVSQPGTLTGSIGVYMAKPVITELLGKVGVNVDSVQAGEHARMFATNQPFSESEWERVNALLDHIYADFTAKVSDARGMTVEDVHEVARGRVWTGRDARERGLVDELGGVETAAKLARSRAGLSDRAPLQHFPRLGALERFLPAESSEDRHAAVSASRLRLDSWGALASVSARLGLPAAGPLTMPGTWEIR
ncbi:signal peptide peptidase SppA [Spiractinospora alimapuensis]|uniref:signal peptide peptidase SppA n=1 Tax=Spiractinospora alimapuensis TaxID=2820884 RepID=UPI001EEAA9AE|nr:signal peptide peptidase SppA [Spiractinospora alimapuensis]QVQ51607.1 signal peptide peptidase SppA [Spiractinospora alimapuensis]